MKFGLIRPPAADIVDTTYEAALREAFGAAHDQVDHGTIGRGASIVVHEHSLFQRDAIKYFTIGRALFGGNAMLYAFEADGRTVNLPALPPILFYKNMAEVERAIGAGLITRPQMAVGTDVFWRWPEPPPTPKTLRTMDLAAVDLLSKHGSMIIDGDTHVIVDDK